MPTDDLTAEDLLDRANRAAELLAALRSDPAQPDSYRDPATAPQLRAHILEIAALLSGDGDPLDAAALDDFPTLWAWVHRQRCVWETFAPKEPPSGDIHDLVLDGRPDLSLVLDDEENLQHPEGSPLAAEPIDGWVAIGHGHDGHRFLVWDASRRPAIRVLEVDNTARDVIIREWDGVESLMVEHVLPDIVEGIRLDHDPVRAAPARLPPGPMAPDEKRSLIGCALVGLALAALAIWLIWG